MLNMLNDKALYNLLRYKQHLIRTIEINTKLLLERQARRKNAETQSLTHRITRTPSTNNKENGSGFSNSLSTHANDKHLPGLRKYRSAR